MKRNSLMTMMMVGMMSMVSMTMSAQGRGGNATMGGNNGGGRGYSIQMNSYQGGQRQMNAMSTRGGGSESTNMSGRNMRSSVESLGTNSRGGNEMRSAQRDASLEGQKNSGRSRSAQRDASLEGQKNMSDRQSNMNTTDMSSRQSNMGRSEMSGRNMGRSEMSGRGMNRSYSYGREGRVECGRMGGGMSCYGREMHGHRWDGDGWMEGWRGRVRHFDDGRWGYFRDGAWFYYDTFYEPDFYFAHPIGYFCAHLFGPRDARVAGGALVGAAVGALVAALVR